MYGTHVTADNNVVLFLFQILKQYTITNINSQSRCLGQERKIYCVTTYLGTKSFKTVSE